MGLLLSLFKAWWPQIVAFVGAVALGFGMAWQWQGLRLDALDIEFTRYRNEVEQNALIVKRNALEKEKFWLGEIENARVNAQTREAQLKKDVAAAQSAGARMHDAVATLRERVSADSVEACRAYVGTLSDVLGECGERYSAVAGVADQCVSDVQTLNEAWPK